MGPQAPLDFGEEPEPSSTRSGGKTPSWGPDDTARAGFALWILAGIGVAFLASIGAYLALVLSKHDDKADVFASLMTGVVPTLAGTIAGYILNDKKK